MCWWQFVLQYWTDLRSWRRRLWHQRWLQVCKLNICNPNWWNIIVYFIVFEMIFFFQISNLHIFYTEMYTSITYFRIGLTCGDDNCGNFEGNFDSSDDCCYKHALGIGYICKYFQWISLLYVYQLGLLVLYHLPSVL